MPCYDSRNDNDCVRSEARIQFRHNSDVADLLCYVLRSVSKGTLDALTRNKPELRAWWEEHKVRDFRKKKQADKEARIKAVTEEIKAAIRKKYKL